MFQNFHLYYTNYWTFISFLYCKKFVSMNSHVGVFVIVIWKFANGAQAITNHLDQELDDADKNHMLGLDQQMEMDRMVMEALGRSNELQRTIKVALQGSWGHSWRWNRGWWGHFGKENNKLPNLDIKQEGNLDTWPWRKCSKTLAPHFLKGVPLTILLPCCYS